MKVQHIDVNGGTRGALYEVDVWLIHCQHCKVVEFAYFIVHSLHQKETSIWVYSECRVVGNDVISTNAKMSTVKSNVVRVSGTDRAKDLEGWLRLEQSEVV